MNMFWKIQILKKIYFYIVYRKYLIKIINMRNDIENIVEKLKESKSRIILSTNLGGRGTDIKTSKEEEKYGGLHVILTKLSSNTRTQKQAFGRTSREGKKGSGQYIIMRKKNLNAYGQLINILLIIHKKI